MPIDERSQSAFLLALKYLTPPDITHFAETGKMAHAIASDESLWLSMLDHKKLAETDFIHPKPDEALKPKPSILKRTLNRRKVSFPIITKPHGLSAKEIYKSKHYLCAFWPTYCEDVDRSDLPMTMKGFLTSDPTVINYVTRTGDWRTLLKLMHKFSPKYPEQTRWDISVKHLRQEVKRLLGAEVKYYYQPLGKRGVGLSLEYILQLCELWPDIQSDSLCNVVEELAHKSRHRAYLSPEEGGIGYSLDFYLKFRRAMLMGVAKKGIKLNGELYGQGCNFYDPGCLLYFHKRGLFKPLEEGGIGLSLERLIYLAKNYASVIDLLSDHLTMLSNNQAYLKLFQPSEKGGIGFTLNDLAHLLEETYDLDTTKVFLQQLAMIVSPDFNIRTEEKAVVPHKTRLQKLSSLLFGCNKVIAEPPVVGEPQISVKTRYEQLLAANSAKPYRKLLLKRIVPEHLMESLPTL